jgi:hypothetical protein
VRRVTRNFVLGLAAVVVLLLALGAVPSYLGSGDVYRLTAEETDASAVPADAPVVNMTDYSDRRYPYLTEALAADDGRSSGYQRGAFGLKESFTHSPFDEVDGLVARNPDARTDAGVRVVVDGSYYLVRVETAPN